MKQKIAFRSVLLGIVAFVLSVTLCACGIFSPVSAPTKTVTVTVSPDSLTVEVGKTAELTAVASNGADIEWMSADDEIATVDEFGTVTGVAVGKVKITAMCAMAFSSCEVTVTKGADVPPVVTPDPPAEKVVVTVSATELTLEVGKTHLLTASASDGSEIKWSSGDEQVAVVSNGLVTAKKAGWAVIIASSGKSLATCALTVVAETVDDSSGVPAGYSLVWHDEFDGNALDMNKWSYQTGTKDSYNGASGPDYWGNNELQYYTDGGNVSVADGSLKMTARKEARGDRQYTSARIVTRDKATWTFGYIEAKMKLPKGDGMWPAFWMLPQPLPGHGTNNEYGGWATNGELDIMEAKGRLNNKVDTTIHFGGSWPNNTYLGTTTTLSSDIDEWHTYGVEWTAEYIAWIIDGRQVFKLNNNRWYSEASAAPSAPFDKPFYILFNFAVGGTYDPEGTRNMLEANSFTSADMLVDYVRVYQKPAAQSSSALASAASVTVPEVITKREG